MRTPPRLLPVFATLLSAALCLAALHPPSPAAADTWLNVAPNLVLEDANWGDWTNQGRIRAAVTTAHANYNSPALPPGGFRAVAVRQFPKALTWHETTRGYINDLRMKVKYHLFAAAFTNDLLEGAYSTDYGTNFTTGLFAADPPPTGASVVGVAGNADYTKDYIHYRSLTPALATLPNWQAIRAGLALRLDWIGKPNPGDFDATQMWVDHLGLEVLQKMTVNRAVAVVNVIPAGALPQGREKIPLLRLILHVYQNTTFGLNSLTFDLLGTCQASDIDRVRFYRDANKSNTIDAGDTEIGSTAVGALTGLSISGAPLVATVPNNTNWLVAVDLSETAVVGRTVGVRFNDEGSFSPSKPLDKVADNIDRANAGSNCTDRNPLWPIESGLATITKKATITASFVAGMTTSVYLGNSFPVTLRVTNAADANSAVNVAPTAPAVAGTGNAVTSTTHVAVSLAAGASADFTWIYTASAAGTVNFTAGATGQDSITLKAVAASAVQSADVDIEFVPVPVLQVTGFHAHPGTVSADGQTFKAQVAVRNSGTANATAVGLFHPDTDMPWAFKQTGGGTATDTTVGLATQDIAVGATVRWNCTFTATGAGALTLSAYAQGSNASRVDANANVVTIVAPALLENVSLVTSPAPDVGVNANFTATLTVKNNGGTVAVNLAPQAGLFLTEVVPGDPDPLKVSGPAPASVASLAPAAQSVFQWTYNSKGDPLGAVLQGEYKVATATGYKDGGSLASHVSGTAESAVFRVKNNVVPSAQRAMTGKVRKLITYGWNSDYYVADEGSTLRAFRADTTQKWSVALPFAVSGYAIYSSYESGQDIIWIASDDGQVYGIADEGASAAGFMDPDIGSSFASLGSADPITTGPVVWDEFIFCAVENMMCKRETASGGIPAGWVDYAAPATITTMPAVDNHRIYFGCDDGKFYALNAGTGALAAVSAASFGGAFTSNPFQYNGKLFCGNADGELIRFNTPMTGLSAAHATVLDLNGAATDALTDLWIEYSVNPKLWVSDGTGGKLFKVDLNNLTAGGTTTFPFAGETLTAPIEWNGVVYFSSTTATLKGRLHALRRDTGASIVQWPYIINNECRCPVTVDVYNSTFLTGADDKNVYFFGLLAP